MTKKRFYQFGFALPLLVPILLLPAIPILRSTNYVAAVSILFFLYSGLIGGIPYLITVIPLLIWSRNQPASEFKKAILVAPVLMLIPLAIVFGVFHFITSFGSSVRDTFSLFAVYYIFFAFCTLVLGYAYVALILTIGSFFKPDPELP